MEGHSVHFTETSRLIALMVQATAKRTIVKEVQDRVKTGKCLHCDKDAIRRGVCHNHYMMFWNALKDQPRKDRPEFEIKAIHDGKILASGQMRELTKPNPFTCDE